MNHKALIAAALCACSTTSLFADFAFEQSSKMTGGMMAGMMKAAGAFSKQAGEPTRSTVLVKGDRMAMATADRINVIDLNKETFTDIDLQKKTYAVITFADMKLAMAKMSEKLKGNEADLSFKADVKNTGATRPIGGVNAKQTILTLSMETTDKKSGRKMNMLITTDMWMAPSMPGYEEVRKFYLRMGQKLAWAPDAGLMGVMAAQQPGMTKGMAEVSKEMSKLDGIPVLQIVRMSGAGTGMPGEQQQPALSASPSASDAAGAAALGRLGLGGLGRKKKQDEQPQQQAQTQATPSGTLMEMTTELTAFSASAVDGTKFEVPAGFQQVDHYMQKMLK